MGRSGPRLRPREVRHSATRPPLPKKASEEMSLAVLGFRTITLLMNSVNDKPCCVKFECRKCGSGLSARGLVLRPQ